MISRRIFQAFKHLPFPIKISMAASLWYLNTSSNSHISSNHKFWIMGLLSLPISMLLSSKIKISLGHHARQLDFRGHCLKIVFSQVWKIFRQGWWSRSISQCYKLPPTTIIDFKIHKLVMQIMMSLRCNLMKRNILKWMKNSNSKSSIISTLSSLTIINRKLSPTLLLLPLKMIIVFIIRLQTRIFKHNDTHLRHPQGCRVILASATK